MDPARVEHIRELGAKWAREDVPALVLLAARRGIVFLHEAWGRLRPEPDSPPLRVDSIFPMSSVTKPVTATCAMILVEDGLIDFNRPVQFYIPEFVGEGKTAVTIHNLMTHTSGLDDVPISEYQTMRRGTKTLPASEPTQHPTIHEYLELLYDAPLSYPPGTQHLYCNAGTQLAGEIVRRVSGKSLDDFARARIFEPLGMSDSSFVVPESHRPRVVLRPEDAPGAAMLVPPFITGLNTDANRLTPWAAGGLYSTAHDVASFGQMFLNAGSYGKARILSRAGVEAMTTNQTPGIPGEVLALKVAEANAGYGWFLNWHTRYPFLTPTLASTTSFSHSGFGGAYLGVDPVNDLVEVYLSTYLKTFGDWLPIWHADLFVNAVTAAVA